MSSTFNTVLAYFVYKRLTIILAVNALLCPPEVYHSRARQSRIALYPKLGAFCDLSALHQILHSTCVVRQDYQTTQKMTVLFPLELAESSGDARLVEDAQEFLVIQEA